MAKKKKSKKPAIAAAQAGGRWQAAAWKKQPTYLGANNGGGSGAVSFRDSARPHGFTLQDEARNTGRNRTNGDARFRERQVVFVSAGMIEPLKDLKSQNDPADGIQAPSKVFQVMVDDRMAEPEVEVPAVPTFIDDAIKHVDEGSGDDFPAFAESHEGVGFFVDRVGDKTTSHISHPPPHVAMPPSDAGDSDSSSEIILFRGRAAQPRARSPPVPSIGSLQVKAERLVLTEHVAAAERTDQAAEESGLSVLGSRANKSERALRKEEEDAILADYIANMAEDSDDEQPGFERFRTRDLGGTDDSEGDMDQQEARDKSGESEHDASGSSSEEISSDEDEDEVSGKSALDDQVAEIEEGMADDNGEDNNDIDNDILGMDDETLARLLAKQEELGLGSDELILFQDTYIGSIAQTGSFASVATRRNKKIKKPKGTFASASALADAFEELQMAGGEWTNPALVQGSRRRRNQPPAFAVSDSELEAAMQATWLQDREKKKQKKAAREDLRAQGLLRKGATLDDPRVKYPLGMTMENIKDELRAFLVSSELTLQLPPMDKHARKILHELANKFKIKSQSTGSGDQRRPTLYRTKGTMNYAEGFFEEATARVGRKYFPRLDVTGPKYGKRPGDRSGGAGATYRDGEVVGASAPELGEGNKGRAMLEKMGWTKGMALGAMDNKGIVEPVRHVVKRTRAGLG